MLTILHKGIQANLVLNPTGMTGDIAHDSALAYITGLDAGVLVGIDTSGYVKLADGDVDGTWIEPIGFLVRDAAGYFYENKPALASMRAAVTFGACVVVTDKIDTALTFNQGQRLYCGTGAKAGLITNVAPDAVARIIGIAGSDASLASPSLTVYMY